MADFFSIAREILESPDEEALANLMKILSTRQDDSEEYQSAKAVYDSCVSQSPNCLVLKLLAVYRSSPDRNVRFRSIYLLARTLKDFRERGFELSLPTLYEIKPLLISCLRMQETREFEIRIFRRIVSCVAYNVVMLDNDGWNELSDCILYLTTTDPLKAFNVFVDLPAIYDDFIFSFMDEIQKKAYEVLHNPDQDRVQDWSLALQSAVKMGIQLVDTKWRTDLMDEILSNLARSASELVDKGMEQFLIQGLDNLKDFLSRDKKMYNYNDRQCFFVREFFFKIRDLGSHVKNGVDEISVLFKGSHNPAIKVNPEHGAELDDDSKSWSLLHLLTIVASTDNEEWYRECAIMQLNDLLSDHSSKKVKIDIAELQPLLISCLKEEGTPEGVFKILCKVVNQVAKQVFEIEDGKWDGLRDYFASESKRNFQRAVHVFQSLIVPLQEEVLIGLLPEISARLEVLRDLVVDKGCWVVAFKGAFCAIIQLIEVRNQGGYVKETAMQMIGSVRELVERGTEDEVVNSGFREMESLVKKQMELYSTSEYKFIKGLLWSLYEIQGMKMESKMVLWRINVRVERGVLKLHKQPLESDECDWLNQPMVVAEGL